MRSLARQVGLRLLAFSTARAVLRTIFAGAAVQSALPKSPIDLIVHPVHEADRIRREQGNNPGDIGGTPQPTGTAAATIAFIASFMTADAPGVYNGSGEQH